MTTRRPSVMAVLAALAMVPAFLGVPRAVNADTQDPTVTGPIGDEGIRGHALWDSWFELDSFGYEEAEYFVSGTAARHPPGADADYTTRIIVTRPSDPDDFNGTVLLEWVNVTAQFENAVDIISAHEMLLRDGYAYVHVSAQAAGICCTPLTPKVWDPVRYADLSHPGDAYSFDIFSQVARAIRSLTGDVDPMDGLPVDVVLAAGQSQSAGRLDTYVREVQPGAGEIDGFLIHGGGGKDHGTAGPAVPVVHLLSDLEANPAAPSTDQNYRLWEIAGSAHSDFWIGYHQIVGQGPRFAGAGRRPAEADEEMHEVAGNYGEQIHPMHGTCIFAGAAFPMRYSVSAAIHHLDRWVRNPDDAPPVGDRFTFDANGLLARDGFGNALGGIRLPPIDYPVATYASTVCGLGGKTVPFTEALLRVLYPSHADYYSAMAGATQDSVAEGFLFPEDAADLLARACAAKVRWQELDGSGCTA